MLLQVNQNYDTARLKTPQYSYFQVSAVAYFVRAAMQWHKFVLRTLRQEAQTTPGN